MLCLSLAPGSCCRLVRPSTSVQGMHAGARPRPCRTQAIYSRFCTAAVLRARSTKSESDNAQGNQAKPFPADHFPPYDRLGDSVAFSWRAHTVAKALHTTRKPQPYGPLL